MRGRLIISCDESVKKTKYHFEKSYDMYDENGYSIILDLPGNGKIDFTKFKQSFYRYLIRKLKGKKYNEDFPECVELIKKAFDQNIDLFDNISQVSVYSGNEELFERICDYYKNSSVSIVNRSDICYPMTRKGYEQACNKYHNNPNVLVKVDGNRDRVSLEVFGKTLDKIEEIVRRIKSYNLSPLEEVIYVFDYAKNRYYKDEDENEPLGKSRDLTSVLFGDKVVCEGYAAIFAKILQKLGFQASKYYVRDYEDGSGHAINIVRIKDDKYKLNGIYYFDPTSDSKREDSLGLSRYNYCGNYRPEMKYRDVTFGDVAFNSSWFNNSDGELLEKIKNPDYDIWGEEERRIHEFYSMYAFVNGSCNLKENRDMFFPEEYYQFKSEITPEYIRKFVRRLASKLSVIDNDVLFKAIYNVRKIEYYENPEEFPLSSEDLLAILNLLKKFKGESLYPDDDELYFFASKLEEIEGIRLTKVLRNISQKR